MASVTIEIPDDLAAQLEQSGLLHDKARWAAMLQAELGRQKRMESGSDFEPEEDSLEGKMLAQIDAYVAAGNPEALGIQLIDQLCGIFDDGDDFLAWYQEEKRRERELEDKKYDRSRPK